MGDYYKLKDFKIATYQKETLSKTYTYRPTDIKYHFIHKLEKKNV